MSPILTLSRLTKRFQERPALDRLSLEVEEGAITGLIGPDGAGKTTLLRLLAGLLKPDGGEIVLRVPREAVGYLPQRFGLYEELTVLENLRLYADLYGVAEAVRERRIGELLQVTGLAPFPDRRAGHLSGGMKQKLALAALLLTAPKLLLLDEPTVGVDPLSRRELWQLLRLKRGEGVTVLLSTAYLDEAERCDRVVLLEGGRLLEEGAPEALLQSLKGRVFWADVPGEARRRIVPTWLRRPEILDAAPQGEGVRIVVRDRPRGLGVPLSPVAPRLEDLFMARMIEARGRKPFLELPPISPPGRRGRAIRVRGLRRRFGRFEAVRGISFEVQYGEIFGLLGANGAGKTTTFRMLCGLLPPSEGEIEVAGIDMVRHPERARSRIGYMAQRFSLYGHLSVEENLRFFAGAYRLPRQKRRERIAWALDHFGLQPFRRQRSGDLPLGYKQRLAMAAALLHEPEILFLDEPTSGVDPIARREFWLAINQLAAGGIAVLVTTHFIDEAEFCDRLVIMEAGRILAQGTPTEIREAAGVPGGTLEEAFIALLEREAA